VVLRQIRIQREGDAKKIILFDADVLYAIQTKR
jgi:hypothetical protein